MGNMATNTEFQEAMECVEALPMDDQAVLIDVIRHRLTAAARLRLVSEVSDAKAEYAAGNLCRGTAEALMAEIGE